MKKSPDTMRAVFLLFCLGLAVTGFSSLSVGDVSERPSVLDTATFS